MNLSTTTGWTSWSVMSGLIFVSVGLVVTVFNCAQDLQQMQDELPNAPMYFGADTYALSNHSQVQFQYAPSQQ